MADVEAEVSVAFDCHAILGESPVCYSSGVVDFVDISGKKVFSYDSVAARLLAEVQTPEQVGCIVPRAKGGVAAALESRVVGVDFSKGEITDTIASMPVHHFGPKIRFNDGKCDTAGRFWVGSMHANWRNPAAPAGRLYSLGADMELVERVAGTRLANGMVWSTDSSLYFFIDSGLRTIDCFDFDSASGSLSNRRNVFTFGNDEPGVDMSELYVTTREDAGQGGSSSAAGALLRCRIPGVKGQKFALPFAF
eukprot:TRINITY_DN14716_c0_g1_i2.p1 TRINITY_DN14716_c0_g1~~TRINITY_DN14716_c0_g1_i2.p1  ORF type:complete len:251 (-),score=52.84 TRINITY_DN14716_c0_g1_i2:228-980(-)